ncbi:hypothetical protein DES53_106173 [Roseimicrobium gellanilyticum]|uniref:Uncharacterized protein n=1 Tax=Roseimicrobium gellanilyticum TaxID=748857 RepID=A0A366HJB7_9BACT|nr:hypothetical protein DES53_106173 [Roseimicrobium gellanilyticum]
MLSQRIEAVHSTCAGIEGANYRVVGIELENCVVLNLSHPHELYDIDSTTVHANFDHEFGDGELSSEQIAGSTLRALLYMYLPTGRYLYVAILNDGTYLTANPAFNYTEFAFGHFDEWKPEAKSRLPYGNNEFLSLPFFNAWTHERVNPFAIQWKPRAIIEVSQFTHHEKDIAHLHHRLGDCRPSSHRR